MTAEVTIELQMTNQTNIAATVFAAIDLKYIAKLLFLL